MTTKGPVRGSIGWSAAVVCAVVSCGGRAENTLEAEGPARQGTGAASGEPEVPRAVDEGPGRRAEECITGQLGASKVRGLTLTEQVDAVSFVELNPMFEARIVVEQLGEPCPDEGSGSTCLLEPGVRHTGYYLAGSEVPHALIVTRAGEHESLGYNTIRDLLGEVDTANEAAVLGWTEGWGASCEDIREDEGGYWLPDAVGCTEGRGWVWIAQDGTVSDSAYCTEGY